MTIKKQIRITGLTIAALLIVAQAATASSHMASDRISDIVNTKHNFAALANPELPSNDVGVQVKAATQNEVCVFCHTPHGDPTNASVTPFLWNHKASSATYTNYSSSSMDATIANPGDASKMCLSCHDGTVAIGAVDVFNGRLASDQTPSAIEMTGDGQSAGMIVDTGTGVNSNLGTDLSNDHPVGFVYSSTVATNDGELADPDTVDYIGRRTGSSVAAFNTAVEAGGSTPGANDLTAASTRVALPLESAINGADTLGDITAGNFASLTSGTVECTTCHDPHIRSTTDENIKFLRLHRFQKGAVSGVSFNIDQDINCIACHDKAGWSTSVHGSITHGDEVYNDDDADAREFPRNIKVYEASCLNCHDAHTEEGARYLLREGADGSDNSAIENTCFQCHTDSTQSILTTANNNAKDIEGLMGLTGGHSLFDLSGGTNSHDVTDANLSESKTNFENRHVTCTDCHNPHRMTKNSLYDDSGKLQATHDHSGTIEHSNAASGALRGATGVEPEYTGVGETFAPFSTTLDFTKGTPPSVGNTDTELLAGDPATEADLTSLVQKEYQVCLKCHSNFGILDADITATNKFNVAMEFQPVNDAAGHAGDPENHNSWHPVIGATGRTAGQNALVAPWDFGPSTQTMYCSDCHTSDDSTAAVGPHGSINANLLVDNWDQNTGAATATDLCFGCHDYDQYANPATAVGSLQQSGFSCAVAADCKDNATANSAYTQNLHIAHASQSDMDTGTVGTQLYECSLCHVKRPHGWKNKAMLVNTNDVDAVLDAKYYFPNAKLAVDDFKTSGNWVRSSSAADDCASSGCHNIP